MGAQSRIPARSGGACQRSLAFGLGELAERVGHAARVAEHDRGLADGLAPELLTHGVDRVVERPSCRALRRALAVPLVGELQRKLERTERERRREELLNQLHITHVRDTLGMSLSGGERRRVEIARALAAEPRFILLDEPFAGVDPLAVADIQHIVRDLAQRGIGVLITDHNVRETLGVCARAYIVNRGTVIASGTAEQVLANPQVREVYLGDTFQL